MPATPPPTRARNPENTTTAQSSRARNPALRTKPRQLLAVPRRGDGGISGRDSYTLTYLFSACKRDRRALLISTLRRDPGPHLIWNTTLRLRHAPLLPDTPAATHSDDARHSKEVANAKRATEEGASEVERVDRIQGRDETAERIVRSSSSAEDDNPVSRPPRLLSDPTSAPSPTNPCSCCAGRGDGGGGSFEEESAQQKALMAARAGRDTTARQRLSSASGAESQSTA